MVNKLFATCFNSTNKFEDRVQRILELVCLKHVSRKCKKRAGNFPAKVKLVLFVFVGGEKILQYVCFAIVNEQSLFSIVNRQLQ